MLNNEQSNQNNIPNHNKQAQLLLDLQILSSIKSKPFFKQQPQKKTQPLKLTQQINAIEHPTIPFGYQSPFETNYMFNPINSNNNSNTNLSYYQDPFIFDSNKNNTLLSYQFDFNNKEMKFTHDSFYQNLFPPSKKVTNLSYRPQEMNQEFNHSQKKENAATNDTTMNNLTQKNGNDDVIIPTPMKPLLGKKNLFINIKNNTKKEREYRKYTRKNTNKGNKIFQCEHRECGVCYKTKKQRMSHHNKMNPECKGDCVNFLYLIRNVKKIMLSSNKMKISNELKKKYEEVMSLVSLEDHVQLIPGFRFDEITPDED